MTHGRVMLPLTEPQALVMQIVSTTIRCRVVGTYDRIAWFLLAFHLPALRLNGRATASSKLLPPNGKRPKGFSPHATSITSSSFFS